MSSHILVTQTSLDDGSEQRWTVDDRQAFVDTVRAAAVHKARQPFVIADPWPAARAHVAGVPAIAGKVGAFVYMDGGDPDDPSEFVEAPGGYLIVPGSGEVLEDTLESRLRACIQWLEVTQHCQVTLGESVVEVVPAQPVEEHPSVAAYRDAADAQAAALAAAVASANADGAPSEQALRALGEAIAQRVDAERNMPSIERLQQGQRAEVHRA